MSLLDWAFAAGTSRGCAYQQGRPPCICEAGGQAGCMAEGGGDRRGGMAEGREGESEVVIRESAAGIPGSKGGQGSRLW